MACKDEAVMARMEGPLCDTVVVAVKHPWQNHPSD